MRVYFAFLGYTLMFCFFVAVWRRLRIALHGVDATGTVAGPYSQAVDGFVYTASRIEYVRADGRKVDLIHYTGRSTSLPTGTRVNVRYLPESKNMHVVKTPAGYALGPATLLGLAAIGLFAAYR